MKVNWFREACLGGDVVCWDTVHRWVNTKQFATGSYPKGDKPVSQRRVTFL